ncbi:phosphate ABC transporter substrate-binding protein PstS [Actinocrinis sp.]|uniref:phosphate ABC transporter substrate-binding protein PstS n=1 Tax=Actinocrinis sp. TaxID=1920516 RepID=UPI002D3DBD6F|nr:phosphate ABC transporter substrate-binding protein PstS [Actinocrinis sp.]HZP50254.1 phosphate ABC transporter substrate-binding protein PstS [Actinocrinis sp.]
MKLQRYVAVAGAGLIATATLAACGSNNNSPAASSSSAGGGASSSASASGGISCGSGTLTLAGSSAQKNAIDKFTKDYQAACSGATINYNPSGSGAGVTSFEQKQVDFAGSDFPLSGTDVAKANARCTGGKAVDLPMVPGAIAVMYNVSGVTAPLNLSAQTLAKIFNGKITTWNDPAIAKDNSGVTLPSTKITTFHRSDKSGTSYNFSNYLNGTDAADFPAKANKQWPGTGGQGENGSSGVAQAVKSTSGGIGYAELSYASANNLQTAKVGNAQGQFVEATTANASAFIGKAKVNQSGNDIQLAFDYTYSDPNAYPAVLVTYEIACDKGNDPAQLPLIKGFLSYMASATAQAELPTAGYVNLPSNIQGLVATAVGNLG